MAALPPGCAVRPQMLATIESSLAQYTRDLCAQQDEAEGTPLRLRMQR